MTSALAALVLTGSVVAAGATDSHCDARRATLCHRPPGNPSQAHTLEISGCAVDAHLAHGDSLGPCCSRDDDCPAGELCDIQSGDCEPAASTTVPGLTTTTLRDGCTSATDCKPNEVCDPETHECKKRCRHDKDCTEPLVCDVESGLCVPSIPTTSTTTTMVSVTTTLPVTTTLAAPTTTIPAACAMDSDCPPGTFCIDETCQGPFPCEACPAPLVCDGGECVRPCSEASCPPGQTCDAESGLCVGGTTSTIQVTTTTLVATTTTLTTTTTTLPGCTGDSGCSGLDSTCTAGVCREGACVAIPRNEGTACDSTEIDLCSTGGVCTSGDCVGSPLCDEQCTFCNLGTCVPFCGNPWEPEASGVTISDALFILRTCVGLEQCATCACDVDASGAVTSTDALTVLRLVVLLPETLACPEHAAATTHP